MAKSYYGYVEREASSGVNWEEIGSELTTKLKQAGDERAARRQAIDDASKEYQTILDDAPSGDFKPANQFALEHAASAQQARLMQDRLLKSGLLKSKDYTIQRQNLTDGTNELFGLSKEYQKEYTEKMTRLKAGESQELEGWLMGQIEGLSNLRNTGTYINPETGVVSISKIVDKDGIRTMSEDPNDFMTVNQLRNRQKTKYDNFKVGATMEAEADRLGSYITTLRNAGGPGYSGQLKKLLDPTERGKLSGDQAKAVDSFTKMEDDMINSYITANPLNGLAVLTNYVTTNPETGKRYELTFDEKAAKADPNMILVRDDGSGTIEPVLTEAQSKVAFDAVRANFRNQIDREETISTYTEQQETATQEQAGRREKAEDNALSSWNDIAYGTPEEKSTAINQLLGTDKAKASGVIAIDTSVPGEIVVTYTDSSKNRTINYDPENITIQEWAELGNEIHGVDDVATVLKRSGGARFIEDDQGNRIPAPLDFSETSMTDVFATREGKTERETATQATTRLLEEGIPDLDLSQEEEPSIAVEKYFEANPPPFGLKITDNFEVFRNQKQVSVSGTVAGKRISRSFDVSKPGAMKAIRDYILSETDLEALALDPTIASQRRNLTYTPRSQRQTGSGGGGGNPPVINTSGYN